MTSRASFLSHLWPHLGVLAVIATACGDSPSPAADTEATGSTTTGGESESSGSGESESSTGDVVEWPYDHAYVKVSFAPPTGAPDASILDQTVTVVIAMDYGECLTAYYEANPFVRQDGELGAGIFGDAEAGGEGWKDLLCSPLFGDHAACSIVWITQRVDAVQSLTITYDITADLATKPLFFGPLPTPEVAACTGGTTPSVRVVDGMSIRGIDAEGNDLWEAESWVPEEAASQDEAPIVVTVAPVGG
jgi:hypothetical protein